MYQLYEKLKDDLQKRRPPTSEELRFAANLPPINAHEASIVLANLKIASLGVRIDGDPLDPAAIVGSSIHSI